MVVPYIAAWSKEQNPPYTLVQRPGSGIAYVDEKYTDRDLNGVLWTRTPLLRGRGRPDFGRVHPLRQRRTMQRLLCQVCAGPADRTDDGVLWLLQDHREDWPGWPNRMGVTEPPVCLPCVRTSVRLCPALRKGAVAVRATTFPVAGVHGTLYAGSPPVEVGKGLVPLEDPAIEWVRAANLLRQLSDCTILTDVTDL
jgi:hypothetical protein